MTSGHFSSMPVSSSSLDVRTKEMAKTSSPSVHPIVVADSSSGAHPLPHSSSLRGYLCSFPITRHPNLGKTDGPFHMRFHMIMTHTPILGNVHVCHLTLYLGAILLDDSLSRELCYQFIPTIYSSSFSSLFFSSG